MLGYQIRISLFSIVLLITACSDSEKDLNQPLLDPVPVGEFIDEWTFSINPALGANFDIAEFRLWVPNPDDVSEIKAILMLAPSFNGNGLSMARAEEWQNFARQNNLCLLAVHFKTFGTGTYSTASQGSGKALLIALDTLANQHGISEIAALPFLMRGYSAGGMFSYSFSSFKPERVIAFANIRGGGISQSADKNNHIPGLMLIAELDFPAGVNRMKNIVNSKRTRGGLWNYAVEPNVDHYGRLINSDALIKVFFTSSLRHRLSEDSNELLTISPSIGWLGNNDTKSVFSYAEYPDDISNAGWLIDENFAKQWSKYQTD